MMAGPTFSGLGSFPLQKKADLTAYSRLSNHARSLQVIFGFGRKQEEEEEEEEEVDLVLFQGALNGKDTNLAGNARLVEAGLIPAKELVTDGLLRRAGTIRVEPKGEKAAVTHVIDGVAYPGQRLSRQEALAITQMMKLLAGLDTKERKKAQAGGLKAEFNEEPWELYVNAAPMEGGVERLTIRTSNLKQKLDTPADLNFPGNLKLQIREAVTKKGIFLVAGGPSSGVTTTLFATVRGLDCFTSQIFTVGDVGTRKLDNITAFQWNEGDTLENTLQRVIRVDADTVVLDPIKDAETAKMLTTVCESIALVGEIAAKDAISGLLQMVKWIGDPAVAAKSIAGVLSQKLLRTLCPECRQAFRPNAQFLKNAGLPLEAKVLYRKPKPVEGEETCSKCGGIGYFGRIAMFEYLEMTDEMRQLVASNPEAPAVKAQMRKEKMLMLQQDGLRLVAAGKTSLEELQRVFKA
jgi:type IV pilus assembly protein PilB